MPLVWQPIRAVGRGSVGTDPADPDIEARVYGVILDGRDVFAWTLTVAGAVVMGGYVDTLDDGKARAQATYSTMVV
jgi:hypothetical protein